jgi:hypothetical protein
MKKSKPIIAITIFIAILLVVFLRKERRTETSGILSSLPEFQSVDINGKIFGNSDLLGKNVYVQFINALDHDQLGLLDAVYSNWRGNDIIFVVCTKEENYFRAKHESMYPSTIILNNNYEYLQKAFKVPYNLGIYYLFDKSGKCIDTGRNTVGYVEGPKVSLISLIKKDKFVMADFIPINKDISTIGWLKQLGDIIHEHDKEYYLFALLTKICDTCEGKQTIQLLKNVYSGDKKKYFIYPSLVLNANKFNQGDISGLRSQLNIEYRIEIADHSLNEKWNYYIDKYRELELSDIVFLVEKNGIIKELRYPGCNCWDNFLKMIHSIEKNLQRD